MKKMLFLLIIISVLAVPTVLAEPVLKIGFDISKNGNISDFSAVVIDGRPLPKNEGDCTVLIHDSDDMVIWTSGYDLDFFIFDAGETVDIMRYSDKIPYSSDMEKISVIYNGAVVFSSELGLCNKDGSCDGDENYLSCPEDCPLNEKDNVCISKADYVCDPDCLEGYDPDCIVIGDSCGDRKCDTNNNENFASCAIDCGGAADGICDRQKDNVCDPDCTEREDVDCRKEEEANPFVIPMVIVVIICIVAFTVFMSYRKRKNVKSPPAPQGGIQYDMQ